MGLKHEDDDDEEIIYNVVADDKVFVNNELKIMEKFENNKLYQEL